jgi:hypothetical protein
VPFSYALPTFHGRNIRFPFALTSILLYVALFRPWSPLASLPPEVDVPRPLLVSGVMPEVSLFEVEDGGAGCSLETCALAIALDSSAASKKWRRQCS